MARDSHLEKVKLHPTPRDLLRYDERFEGCTVIE